MTKGSMYRCSRCLGLKEVPATEVLYTYIDLTKARAIKV